MNLADLKAISANLPEGAWSLKQTTRVADGEVAIGRLNIIGPGNHFVGEAIGLKTYRPSSTVSYWYIVQMREAGWEEEGLLDKNGQAETDA